MKYISPINARYGLTPYSLNSFTSLDREFEKLFGALPSLFDYGSEWFAETSESGPRPRWFENDDAYVARIELPGVDASAVSLEIVEDVLKLSADRKDRSKTGAEERSIEIRRSFTIPEGVDEARVSAAFEDGILSVTLPKTEATKPRQIKIN